MNIPTWKLLAQIFWTFFKIGPVTFGGGYAMIPLIEREVVERRNWVKSKDIADLFAISGSIPGAIAFNSASFIGFRIAGIPGAIAATVGVLLPTFAIIIALCILLLKVQDHPKIEAAMRGIRATTVALIVYAGIKIGKTAVLDKATLVTMLMTVLVLVFSNVNPVLVIIGGALVGIGLVSFKSKLGMKVALDDEQSSGMRYKYADYYLGDGI
ncbi:chromate transporter [Paenibacillus sp. GD4]|uniref:chromate transporter n=1 Tax=Paenibacillus sp. GD4 TaxID=3068890 RepID=UPI00279663AC|nr:chromate transporter [Paenibacillus sp. GD4]MDQ1913612.1 chromate transporter [Paenibacillus sp. GD4]